MERPIPDAGHAVGDRHARQAHAIHERQIPDARDAVGDRHTRDRLDPLITWRKGFIPDRRHRRAVDAGGNDQCPACAGVAGDGACAGIKCEIRLRYPAQADEYQQELCSEAPAGKQRFHFGWQWTEWVYSSHLVLVNEIQQDVDIRT